MRILLEEKETLLYTWETTMQRLNGVRPLHEFTT